MADAIRVNEKKAGDTVMRLLSIEGLSGGERPVADAIRGILRGIGIPARAMTFDGAERRMKLPEMRCGNLVVEIPGEGRSKRAFSAHMDTVTLARGASPVLRGRRVFPKGDTALGADDRSGVAAILSGLRTVIELGLPHPPLVLIFTAGEEIGLFGSRYVDRSALRGVRLAFNFDGGSPGEFDIGAPSSDHFTIEVTGIASHAGSAPEKGASAVAAAAAAISQLKSRGWFGRVRKGRLSGTSNVGRFTAEGPTNIVSPRAVIEGESRSHSDAFLGRITAEFRRAFEKACRATRAADGRTAHAHFRSERIYATFRLKASDPVVRFGLRAAKAAALDPRLVVGGGGLDANFFNGYGMPTLTMGAGAHDVHTPAEWLDLDEHLAACRLAAALMTVREGEA